MLEAKAFENPKPTSLLQRVIRVAMNQQDLILDFFAGSGTTAHAVMSLNRQDGGTRRFVLVEMGEYFDSVLKPRVIKAAYSPDWRDGVPGAPTGEPHLIRVERLESYEDALNNITFDPQLEQAALAAFKGPAREDYIVRYMLEMESRNSTTLLALDQLRDPFQYQLNISDGDGGTPAPVAVDLPATFAHLIGLTVRTIRAHWGNNRRYLEQRGELADGSSVVVIWRDMNYETADQLDIRADEAWIVANIPLAEAQIIYINGDSFVPHSRSLDPVFMVKMGRG